MKKIIIIALAFLALSGFIKADPVVYSVLTPSTTNICYISGIPTGWVKTPMTYVSTDGTGKKLFTVTLEVDLTNPANKDTYKYLCGPLWTFEEKKADGSLWNPGRTYPGAGINDVVANWVYVCTPLTINVTVPAISPETNMYLKGYFYTGTNSEIIAYYPQRANGNINTKLVKQADGTYSITIYSNRTIGSRGEFGYYRVHAGNGDSYNETDGNGVALTLERDATAGVNNITVARWNMIQNGMKFTVNVPSDISTCYMSNPSVSNSPFWAMYKNGSASSFSLPLTPEIVNDPNFAYLYYKSNFAMHVEGNASNQPITTTRTIPYVANTTKVDDVLYFTTPTDVDITTTNPTINSLYLSSTSNVTIKNGASLSLNTPITLNTLVIDSLGKLNIGLDNSVNVSSLTLKAGKNSSFNTKLDGSITATTLRFLKTIDDSKWYFLSFPCDVNVSEILLSDGNPIGTLGSGGNWFIKEYNGAQRAIVGSATSNWNHISGNTLFANKGYIFGLATGMGTKEISIPLNPNILQKETEKTIPVTAHTGAASGNNHGWNLVGQPYLSKITGSAADINYMTFSDGVSTYTQYSKALGTLPNIDPFAAYFVQVESSTPISVALTARQNSPTLNNNMSEIVNLTLSTSVGSDNSTLIINDDESASYQIGRDLEKWLGLGTDKPQIYTTLNGLKYAFNALTIKDLQNLPIGFYTKSAGIAIISATTNATNLTKLILTDSKTGISTDLLISNYSFETTAGVDNSRFVIGTKGITTDIDSNNNSIGEVKFSNSNGLVKLTHLPKNSEIRVYDVLGHIINNQKLSDYSWNFSLKTSGVYIFQIRSGSEIVVKKIIY